MKKYLVVLGFFLMAGCGGASTDSSESSAEPNSTNVGEGIDQAFGITSVSESQSLEFVDDPCDVALDGSSDIALSKAVAAGHYGRPSAGKDVTANFDCDASSADTSWLAWTINQTVQMNCVSGRLSFEGGSGIVSFASSPTIHGQFQINGASYFCDMVFDSESNGTGQPTIDCETADGTALTGGVSTDSCQPVD